jgi:general secretion pathway protein I
MPVKKNHLPKNKAKHTGFTLLEAIVALVIISATGTALFSWINTNLHSLSRVQETTQRHQAMRNALALMENINPTEQPSGEYDFGDYTVYWEARLLKAMQSNQAPSGQAGGYLMGLFDVDLRIVAGNQELTQFTVRKTGYMQKPGFFEEKPNFF